jgi:hypothetical protein
MDRKGLLFQQSTVLLKAIGEQIPPLPPHYCTHLWYSDLDSHICVALWNINILQLGVIKVRHRHPIYQITSMQVLLSSDQSVE